MNLPSANTTKNLKNILYSSCKSFQKLSEAFKLFKTLENLLTKAWLNPNISPPEDTETKLLAGG